MTGSVEALAGTSGTTKYLKGGKLALLMQARALLAILVIAVPASLSGCIASITGTDLAFGAEEVEPTGRTVEIDMWVETIHQEIYPGFQAELWAFCAEAAPGSEDAVQLRDGQACSVPGPTIHVDQGDLLRVNFRNPHDFPHTIHWHGQIVPNEADGVPGATQDTTEQGHEYTYEYLVKREGTLMYHCHVDTQHHVFMGLYGALIVDPQDDSLEPDADVDKTLVLSHGNKTHMAVPAPGGDPHAHHRGEHGSGNPGKQNGPFHVDYDLFMVNGKSFPLTLEDEESLVKVQEGDLVRLRLINIGFETETWHLHGHDMVVTHKDGKALTEDQRYKVDTLRISPGERYDVAFEADNPGKWVMHTHLPHHVTNDHMYPGGMLTQVVYEGYENASFRAELPGGAPEAGLEPSGPPLPDDWEESVSDEVNDLQYDVSYDVPVEDERAQLIQLDLALESGSAADELTISLVGPDGQVLKSLTATPDEPDKRVEFSDVSTAGTYTAQVTGQGLQASYTLDMLVQYTAHDPHAGHGAHH